MLNFYYDGQLVATLMAGEIKEIGSSGGTTMYVETVENIVIKFDECYSLEHIPPHYSTKSPSSYK